MVAGKSSGDEEKCLEDQLRDAKAAVGNADTELKQLQTKISHSEKELKEKKEQLISKHDEAVAVESELRVRREEVESIKAALESVAYEEGQMEVLQKVIINILVLLLLVNPWKCTHKTFLEISNA